MHQHDQTWALLLAGSKTWFVAPHDFDFNQTGNDYGKYQSFTKLAAKSDFQQCTQQESELVIVPAGWPHATFNLEHWTLGFGGQGRTRQSEYAAMVGDIAALEALGDADPKAIASFRPLFMAASVGNCAVIKWLVTRGSKVTTKNKEGLQSMHLAAQGGHCAVIELLASLGSKIAAKKQGWFKADAYGSRSRPPSCG